MKRFLPYLILIIVMMGTIFASAIAPYDPMQIHDVILQSPNKDHFWGTDSLGRDLFSRLLYGGRYSLSIAVISTTIALSMGIMIGVIWGLAPRWLESLITVIISSILAIPSLLIALVILTLLGRGIWQIGVAIGISQIGLVVQVVRGAIISIRNEPYIEGAYAVGATPWRIIAYYILPNIFSIIATYGGVVLGYSLLNGSTLTFLGLGELGVPDWGVILAEGRAVFDVAPQIAIYTGLLITSVVFSINIIVERWVK